MLRTHRPHRLALVTAVAAGGLALAAPASPASAATARNGVCETGEFCLYYFSGLGGSVSDFSVSVANYGSSQPSCFEFRGPGSGRYQCVKNNAQSAWNRSSRSVTVYFNSNYGGVSDTFLAGERGDLIPALRDNNASHRFR